MCGGGSGQIQDTEDMRVQQEINASLWNYFKESYAPLIEKYTGMVTEPSRQAGQEKKVAGQIRGEVMKNVTPEMVSDNPVVNAKRLSGLATAETGAQVQGQGGVRGRQLGEMQNVIDIGRGEETEAQVGLGEIAGESIRSEIARTQTQQIQRAATENAYGSVAGAIAAGLLTEDRPLIKNPRTGRKTRWY